MKRRGFIAQIVERWNPFARVRQDLFQVIDIVADALHELERRQVAVIIGGGLVTDPQRCALLVHFLLNHLLYTS